MLAFGIRSITAIFLGVVCNCQSVLRCDVDINAASQHLAQWSIQIRNVTTHCKTESKKCSAELSSVVAYMRAAKDSMSHAVAGCLAWLGHSQACQDDGKYVGQDFAIIGFKTMEGIQDCVLSNKTSCADDVNFILEALDNAIANIDKLVTDCDFPVGSKCANDFALLAEKLSEAKNMFIKAEADCKIIGDACIDDMLVGVSEFLDASSWGLMSIYDCTNSMPRRHEH